MKGVFMINKLSDDKAQLINFMKEIRHACKQHTASDIVAGRIPIATVYHFIYEMDLESLSITSVTLKKLTRRLDELDQSDYTYRLQTLVANFVKHHINVAKKPKLIEWGLTYDVINKINDFDLNKSYRMQTLIKYADIVQNKHKEVEL